MLTRRAFATTSLAFGAASAALAQGAGGWPERPVAAVVPWPAGGPTDAFARLISQRLSSDLGRPFVVDNRGGANGTIGMASAARARPDGYTVVIAPNSTYAVAPHLYKVPYEQERDFVGVGLLVSSPLFMLVPRNSPVKSVAEYVASAKQPRSRLDYANAGVGATSHLATEMFLQSAGIEVTEVGYRGGGPAIQAVLAGEAGMLFMPAAAVMSFIQSGDLRPLAATTRERSPLAPRAVTRAPLVALRERLDPGIEPLGPLLLRAVSGGFLVAHGWPKWAAGVEAVAGGPARRGTKPALPLAWMAVSHGTVGGPLTASGPLSRPLALIAAGHLAFIAFWAFWPSGSAWIRGGWECPAVWVAAMLAATLQEGGPWSLNRLLFRR